MESISDISDTPNKIRPENIIKNTPTKVKENEEEKNIENQKVINTPKTRIEKEKINNAECSLNTIFIENIADLSFSNNDLNENYGNSKNRLLNINYERRQSFPSNKKIVLPMKAEFIHSLTPNSKTYGKCKIAPLNSDQKINYHYLQPSEAEEEIEYREIKPINSTQNNNSGTIKKFNDPLFDKISTARIKKSQVSTTDDYLVNDESSDKYKNIYNKMKINEYKKIDANINNFNSKNNQLDETKKKIQKQNYLDFLNINSKNDNFNTINLRDILSNSVSPVKRNNNINNNDYDLRNNIIHNNNNMICQIKNINIPNIKIRLDISPQNLKNDSDMIKKNNQLYQYKYYFKNKNKLKFVKRTDYNLERLNQINRVNNDKSINDIKNINSCNYINIKNNEKNNYHKIETNFSNAKLNHKSCTKLVRKKNVNRIRNINNGIISKNITLNDINNIEKKRNYNNLVKNKGYGLKNISQNNNSQENMLSRFKSISKNKYFLNNQTNSKFTYNRILNIKYNSILDNNDYNNTVLNNA